MKPAPTSSDPNRGPSRRAPSNAPDTVPMAMIVTACDTVIRDVLKPRFLPEIRPTERNYVIDIHGAYTTPWGTTRALA
jgi:hypothetical protein